MANKALQEEHKVPTHEHKPISSGFYVHVHEPVINLMGAIVCRTCGETMTSYEEEITRVQSRKRARRILDEIGVSGEYMATGYADGFMTFGKPNDDYPEILYDRVFIRVLGNRSYAVVKSVEQCKGGG